MLVFNYRNVEYLKDYISVKGEVKKWLQCSRTTLKEPKTVYSAITGLVMLKWNLLILLSDTDIIAPQGVNVQKETVQVPRPVIHAKTMIQAWMQKNYFK